MALRLTLQQFLQTAKRSFTAAVETSQPVTLVTGNVSADLDSFACSILFAYLQSSIPLAQSDNLKSQSPPFLPLLNIPRAEIALRPELVHLANRLTFRPADLFCLDDVPENLSPSLTNWVLVDHNVLQDSLGRKFASRVTGIIDHHDDEGHSPIAKPRYIAKSGSCASLVVEHFRQHWDKMNLPEDINLQLSELALAPILIDTANLTSKVTPVDVEIVSHLTARLGDKFTRKEFYEDIFNAKGVVDAMPLRDLLRKDYKEWTEENGIRLGISSVGRSLAWMANREKGEHEFLDVVKKWAEERQLDIVSVMTTNGKQGSEFKRDLFVWGVNKKTEEIATSVISQAKDEFKLENWKGEEEEEEEEEEAGEDKLLGADRHAWNQGNLAMSRKQVAPLLRGIAKEL